MYGTTTCVDCYRSKQYLDTHDVAYEFINIETEPEAIALVERLNNGMRIVPTIIFDDGSMLAEPSNDELAKKLLLNK